MFRRLVVPGVVLGAALALPNPAAAQIPEEFHNLQVLPEDIAQRELIGVMRGFALGLGVRCTHCHVGEEGQPFSEYDFESDDKETKRKARFMLQMVSYLNDERLPGLTEIAERAEPAVKVTCETCHNGKPLPRSIGEVLVQTIDADGIDAAVAKYGELREEFYGSAAYDFSELALLLVAGDLGRAQPDAARALAELNLEHYPESVNSWLLLGQLNMQSGDTDAVRAAVQKALEIDPENPQAARLLSQLEGN
jgi:tetratricopeptide (TPR) repeat protein